MQGAVFFTSLTSCLSWYNLSSRHWSGPALWYAGIILALIAVILGNQQVLVIPDTSDTTAASTLAIQKRLMTSDSSSASPRPKRLMLFTGQAPIMSLSYAMICFLVGMVAVVIGPLAGEQKWGDDAKVGANEPLDGLKFERLILWADGHHLPCSRCIRDSQLHSDIT